MTVEVIVPWRNGCDHRQAALTWVLERWSAITNRVTIAPHDVGPWVKALAVMPAVAVSTADVVVVADADVWTDHVTAAITAIESGRAAWATPHDRVHRLNAVSTAQVIAGVADITDPTLQLTEPPHLAAPGGGIVVATRDTVLDVPLDPRFQGWGGEDYSWSIALSQLAGKPWRSAGPIYHLWHPPQPRVSRNVGSRRNLELLRRYQRNASNPPAIRNLVDEAKEVLACPEPDHRSPTRGSSTS